MNNKLDNLIKAFRLLPGVGKKTAERMAFHLLNMDEDRVNYFTKTIDDSYKSIRKCNNCGAYAEGDTCSICLDDNRNKQVLCIVEDPKAVYLMENAGFYKGKYFVLNGLISPIDGINPEDIGINDLIQRIKKDDVKEIILTIKNSIEGETTALYLKEILKNTGIKITKISSGIPFGADLDYIDDITLEKALEERKEL